MPVVAYGALVPPAALEIPRYGWINLHFSLLPAWRGAAPVQHAVLHGDEVTGASVFQLEAGLDTGPVFGTLVEKVGPRDTAGDLLDRLAGAGGGLLVSVLDAIGTGAARAVPQPVDGVSLAPEDHRRGRRGPVGRPRVRGGPAHPGLYPGPGRVDDLPRRAAQARPGDGGR